MTSNPQVDVTHLAGARMMFGGRRATQGADYVLVVCGEPPTSRVSNASAGGPWACSALASPPIIASEIKDVKVCCGVVPTCVGLRFIVSLKALYLLV